jgi:hypothetical protein
MSTRLCAYCIYTQRDACMLQRSRLVCAAPPATAPETAHRCVAVAEMTAKADQTDRGDSDVATCTKRAENDIQRNL